MDIILKIKEELNVEKWQVEAAVKLIDEGNTIPFISRYRKEATGSLNDEQLRNLGERLTYLRNLEDKKAQVIGSIEEQGKLTDELRIKIEEAQTLVVVEDLYRPYRPKRRTRAIIAREKGLEGLANIISLQMTEKSLEEEAEKYISKGMLVPDDTTIKIVEERLKADDIVNGLILDGFPRTIDQAIALDKMLEKDNKEVTLAINLETPEDEIIDRITCRRVCSNQECKTVYNTKLNPPKVDGVCDKCGNQLIQRKDDNEETVKNRLVSYYKQSAPIVDYYKNKGLLYSSEVSLRINKMAVDVADEVYAMLTK